MASAVIAAAPIAVLTPAQAEVAHGSIAIGLNADGAVEASGFAWNFAAYDEARERALSECADAGGMRCREIFWFRNRCGALALDKHGSVFGVDGITGQQASEEALRSCEAADGAGCRVVGARCAVSGGQAGTWSAGVPAAAMEATGKATEQEADGDSFHARVSGENCPDLSGTFECGFAGLDGGERVVVISPNETYQTYEPDIPNLPHYSITVIDFLSELDYHLALFPDGRAYPDSLFGAAVGNCPENGILELRRLQNDFPTYAAALSMADTGELKIFWREKGAGDVGEVEICSRRESALRIKQLQ